MNYVTKSLMECTEGHRGRSPALAKAAQQTDHPHEGGHADVIWGQYLKKPLTRPLSWLWKELSGAAMKLPLFGDAVNATGKKIADMIVPKPPRLRKQGSGWGDMAKAAQQMDYPYEGEYPDVVWREYLGPLFRKPWRWLTKSMDNMRVADATLPLAGSPIHVLSNLAMPTLTNRQLGQWLGSHTTPRLSRLATSTLNKYRGGTPEMREALEKATATGDMSAFDNLPEFKANATPKSSPNTKANQGQTPQPPAYRPLPQPNLNGLFTNRVRQFYDGYHRNSTPAPSATPAPAPSATPEPGQTKAKPLGLGWMTPRGGTNR